MPKAKKPSRAKRRRSKTPPPVSAIERRRVRLSLEAYERMALLRALDECDYHIGDAATLLVLSKATMYRKLVEHGIPRRAPGARNTMRVRAWYLPTREPVTLAGYERLALGRALGAAGGSVSAAGHLLGVSRSTMFRKVRAHGVETVRP
jgi:transcriptional regulator of acetoin/glycerol metabolism